MFPTSKPTTVLVYKNVGKTGKSSIERVTINVCFW